MRSMIGIKTLLVPIFFFLFISSVLAFTFSEYAANEEKEEKKAVLQNEVSVQVSCSSALKNKKIALLIAEQEHLGPFVLRQTSHSRFYQEINQKLQQLGLRTYSPEEIGNQIAVAELNAILNNDITAAENASKRLGADFFIKGLISTRTGTNGVTGIKEVYLTFDFTLTDASGSVISTSSLSGESYSNADVIGSLYRLVKENSSRLVNTLYNDYCSTKKKISGSSGTSVTHIEDTEKTTGHVAKAATMSGNDNKAGKPADKSTAVVPKTIIVSAEGLADPKADTYKKDQGLMVDALRADAKRQAIEKAVGAYVDSSTLVENFMLINDRVLTKSSGLIKKIIKETPPWLGEDGLMHMMIKAEVFLADVQEALQSMSQNERLHLIKESGNPTVSVAIVIKDARRSSSTAVQRSDIAENVLKSEFKRFGYRVWSEEYSKSLKGKAAAGKARKEADFSVLGEVKFTEKEIFLKASGNTLVQHVLTSWTVKCMNNHTGEEIYFNNKIPHKKSWESEDAAVADIGEMIGKEFSADFFKEQLMRPSMVYQLELTGSAPIHYDTALLLKKEFVGLRPILNVELRDFSEGNQTFYEIEFTGKAQNFNQILNDSVLKPLNAKLGDGVLRLIAHHGNVVKVAFAPLGDSAKINEALSSGFPAALAASAPERVRELISDPEMLRAIEKVNPYMQDELAGSGTDAMIQNF